jgi:hypothetical protein
LSPDKDLYDLYDSIGGGVLVGHLKIRLLAYADDVCIIRFYPRTPGYDKRYSKILQPLEFNCKFK